MTCLSACSCDRRLSVKTKWALDLDFYFYSFFFFIQNNWMITNVYTLSVNNTRKVNSTQNIETNRHFHGTFVSELTQKLQNRKLKIKECICYKLFKEVDGFFSSIHLYCVCYLDCPFFSIILMISNINLLHVHL